MHLPVKGCFHGLSRPISVASPVESKVCTAFSFSPVPSLHHHFTKHTATDPFPQVSRAINRKEHKFVLVSLLLMHIKSEHWGLTGEGRERVGGPNHESPKSKFSKLQILDCTKATQSVSHHAREKAHVKPHCLYTNPRRTLKTRSPYTLRFSDEVLVVRRGLEIVVR